MFGNMQSDSLIASSFKKARMAMAAVILSVVVCAALISGEHFYFQGKIEDARIREQASQISTHAIITLDDQLTMSAALAAQTGKKRWINRYNQLLPDMEIAVKNSLALASPEGAAEFNSDAKLANSELEKMEVQAIDLAKQGELLKAQSIFASSEYIHYKNVLSNATTKFIADVTADVEADLRILTIVSSLTEAFSLIISLTILGFVWRYIAVTMNASESIFMEAENQMRRSAEYDHLTGLPNRALMITTMEKYLQKARSNKQKLAAMVIDLDRFKPVNDDYGHLVGDVVLKEVAKRMQDAFGEHALCARLGGDEFVCILHRPKDVRDAQNLAVDFVSHVRKPITSAGVSVNIGASVGISFFPDHATDCDSLLFHADVALYEVKRCGRGAALIYDPNMQHEKDVKNTGFRGHAAPEETRNGAQERQGDNAHVMIEHEAILHGEEQSTDQNVEQLRVVAEAMKPHEEGANSETTKTEAQSVTRHKDNGTS